MIQRFVLLGLALATMTSCKPQLGSDIRHIMVGSPRYGYVASVEPRDDGSLSARFEPYMRDIRYSPIADPYVVVELDKHRLRFETRLETTLITTEDGELRCYSSYRRATAAKPLGQPESRSSCHPLSRDAYRLTMYAPQTPHPPYPYQQRHVRFESWADHASLDGTIFMPPGEGPFPGVVLLSGSGWDNRDYKRGGHRCFLVVADHLARRGVASLRFDDRSGFTTASLADLAGDAAAALHTLRAQTPIDPTRTGFLGHSEGGLVAGIAATSVAEAATFFVFLGSPIATGPQLVRWQTKAKGGTAGQAEVAVAAAQFREAVAEAKARGVSELQIEIMEQQAEAKIMAIADASPAERFAGASRVWSDAWTSFDDGSARPSVTTTNYEKAFAEIYAPVLALWGSQDNLVPPEVSRDALQKALRHLPAHYKSLEILAGLDHSLCTADVEDADDPRRFETIAPVALERISSWIRQTVVGAGKERPD